MHKKYIMFPFMCLDKVFIFIELLCTSTRDWNRMYHSLYSLRFYLYIFKANEDLVKITGFSVLSSFPASLLNAAAMFVWEYKFISPEISEIEKKLDCGWLKVCYFNRDNYFADTLGCSLRVMNLLWYAISTLYCHLCHEIASSTRKTLDLVSRDCQ